MTVIEAILTRRSIRKYTAQKVSEDEIITLLKAAMYAPSSRNQQAWQFIVVDNRKLLDSIPAVHPYAEMVRTAPLAIMVCGDTSIEKSADMWIQDCSAATQNLLLAAHGLGLGAVWLGVHFRKERSEGLKSLFGLPGHVHPLSLVAIGYPDEVREQPDRFRPDRIHRNRWKP